MNLPLVIKLLMVGTIWAPLMTEAESSVCSPSNTNIEIDAQVPGEITTPLFEEGSSDSNCTWKIQAPQNFRLAITIKALKFNGQDDYLVIRDGPDEGSPLIGHYGSCTTGSLTLYSSGISVFLQTVSAAFSTSNELRIAYKAIAPEDVTCSNQGENLPNFCSIDTNLGGLSGVISSPNFPNNYGAGEDCIWKINVQKGYRVQFAIHFLGIEDHRYSRPGTCADDNIAISEVRGNGVSDVKLLCGCQQLFSFVSSEEKIFVTFRTYKKHNWPGFYATYHALSPEECPPGNTNCPLKNTDPIGFNAQGQVCRPSGGKIILDNEAKIDVDCRPDYIEVSLKISDFPGLVVDGSSLHLEDNNCFPGYKDDKMVKFKFGLEDCKTSQVDDGEKIYYGNKVYLKAGEPAEDKAITREHVEIIPFSCGYDKKKILSKVSYSPHSVLFITDAEGIGNFTFYMDMYEDGSNNKTVAEYPKEVGLGQTMYFGFRVESGDSDLVVFPDVCKATASSSFDSTPEHLIIEKACSKDNTLDYQYGKKSEHFFNLAAFRFTKGYDDVYIHCKLTVCRKVDDESRCAKGCQPTKRKRRSAEEDWNADLYVGPLKPKIVKNEAAKEHRYADDSTDSDNSMVLIVGILVGVLGTVAIGLIAAAIVISRRRNSSGKGSSLIVSDEM